MAHEVEEPVAIFERQLDLLKVLKATGKPLVVLVNGRPLTLPWDSDNASAIL